MPIIGLVQFTGSQNTQQYRLAELFALATNEDVLRDAKVTTTTNNNNNNNNNSSNNDNTRKQTCTCCCNSKECQDAFVGNASSNNCTKIPTMMSSSCSSARRHHQLIRVIGGCPTICSLHTLKRKNWCVSTQEEEEENEISVDAATTNSTASSCSCCTSCHLPTSISSSSSLPKDILLIYTRMFRAFFTNNTSTLFVEFASFSLMKEIAKRSIMIANIWLVAGIGEDDKIPRPTIKELRGKKEGYDYDENDLFGKGPSEALQSSLKTAHNNNSNNSLDKIFAVNNNDNNNDDDSSNEQYRTFMSSSSHHANAKSFTYRLEYASEAKFSPEIARHCVSEILVKDPVHVDNLKQRYDFRTPETSYMLVVVPPPGLKNPQMLPKDEQQKLKEKELEEVSSSNKNRNNNNNNNSNERSGPVTRTFYLHAVLFEDTPRAVLMNLYTLKLRRYIGTTTMVPELSFLLNNCGRVKKGDLVLDPFCGTGSLLMAARHIGAQTLGFDIDGRVMRKGTKESVHTLQASEYRFQEAKKKIPEVLNSADAKKFLSEKQLALAKEEVDDENDDRETAVSSQDAAAASSSSSSSSKKKKTNFENNLDQNPQASLKQNFRDMNLGFGPNCFVGSFSAFSKSFGRPVHRPWLDAIITDPPYGIRETKRRTEETFFVSKEEKMNQKDDKNENDQQQPPDQDSNNNKNTTTTTNTTAATSSASTRKDLARPLDTHPLYEATELLVDLICFAADSLVDGGRLVFWMSVTSYDYNERQLPRHPGLELISNIPQQLNVKTVRRLVVMERKARRSTGSRDYDDSVNDSDKEERDKLKQTILMNTMRGLELRKAYDLPVNDDFSSPTTNNNDDNNDDDVHQDEANISGNTNNNNNRSKNNNSNNNSKHDVNAADVQKNIEAALKKRLERIKKNEATAKWREENMGPNSSKKKSDANQKVVVAGADDDKNHQNDDNTVEINQPHTEFKKRTKAEKRQINFDNRQRKIENQRNRRERAVSRADDDDGKQEEGKPKTPPKPE